MSNQSRSGTIALFIGAVSSTLLLCCWLSLARSAAEQIASDRLQNIQKAQAKLQQQETADWSEVISADKAEIAALNSATTAAMKAGNADAVEAAQKLLKTVKTRLAEEKALTTFPPNFQSATNTTGQQNPVLKIELARNKAVVSAVAQVKKAQLTCHDAVVAADQAAITQWKQQIAAAMKAGNPQAVVTDMSAMKQLRQQLQQDSMAAPSLMPAPGRLNSHLPALWPQNIVPHPGILNSTVPTYQSPGFSPGAAQAVPAGNANSMTNIGGAIPTDQWPKLIRMAKKPVAAYSVPSLAAELERYRTDPGKLIGKRVVAFLKMGKNGNTNIAGGPPATMNLLRQERLLELGIRNQIIEHFKLIRKEARLRRKAEYQYQLDILKSESPHAMGWQVNQNLLFAEKDECSSVTKAAYSNQRKDLRIVALAFRGPQNNGEIVSPAEVQHPKSGAVYGIVVGISSQSIARATPQLSLPSGTQLRSQVYFHPLQPPSSPYIYLANIPAVDIPSQQIPPDNIYTVHILYCARAPHYFSPAKKGPTGPIKSYVFKMKSGTKMEATTYTTGSFYYHLKWNGINLLVAKDLVVRIQTVR